MAAPDVPDELEKAIKDGRCAVFVGAGLSVGAGFPTWNSLLENLITTFRKSNDISEKQEKELRKLVKDGGRSLMVAQELCDRADHALFLAEIVKIFSDKSIMPTAAHSEVASIPFNLAVTTNYDRLLEQAYVTNTGVLPTVYTHVNASDFADAIWRNEFFILKAHGTVEARTGIILTQRDYRNIIFHAHGYQAALLSIFTTKTVFFVGVSLNDPETQLLLSYLHDAFHGSGANHFAIVPKDSFTETESNRWKKDFKVHCIRYDASAGHPEIVDFLKKLPH